MPVCREERDNPIIFMSKNERLAMHDLFFSPGDWLRVEESCRPSKPGHSLSTLFAIKLLTSNLPAQRRQTQSHPRAQQRLRRGQFHVSRTIPEVHRMSQLDSRS